MANESVGSITCAWCGTEADVRKNSKRKYYVYCSHCGINQPALPPFQVLLINRARFNPDERAIVERLAAYKGERIKVEAGLVPVHKPEPVQKHKPEPVQERKPEPVQERKPEPAQEHKPEPVQEHKQERKRGGFGNLAAGFAAFMGAEE